MRVNFISSREAGETRTIYTWSNNVGIMQGIDTNDIINELLGSLLHDYQEKLKTIKGSDFVFESVDWLDYKIHRVRLKRDGSYIKYPKWFENKKATINPKNENNDECFRWSIICALHYNDIMIKEFENISEKVKYEDKGFLLHKKKTGKNLNKIINQLLLMSYFHQKIVKK